MPMILTPDERSVSGTLIVPGWFVPTATEPPRRGTAVRISAGRVADIGPASELRERYVDDEVIEAPDSVLLPGFVNAHMHMYGTLAHGIPVDPVDSFWSFLSDYWWPKVEDRLDHFMIEAATDWVCMEMLRSGTTSFYDILEAPRSLPEALLVEKEAVEQWGLRGILSFEATERLSPENGLLGLDENVRLIEACRTSDSLVSGMMCFHTTFTCSQPFIEKAFALGQEHDVLVHAHVNEGVHEGQWCKEHNGKRTLEFYDSLGVLSPRFLASQCVQLSFRERELLAERGVRVTHMPLANCEVGGGIAPIPELLSAGVTVGLGSDGYINDFFEVMRGAALLHKARLLDPATMPAQKVLELATEGGAAALGLDGVGRLELGWQADLQLVELDLPTPVTEHNLFDQLVLWRNYTNVTDVMIAGTWRVRDREILGADLGRIRALAREQATRLWRTAK